jgi:hypothetical protein
MELAEVGIKISALFAGFGGGLVGAWADGRSGWKVWVGYVLCGGITANYLAEPATHIIPLVNEGGAGFAVGTSALIIVRTLIGLARKWNPKINGSV